MKRREFIGSVGNLSIAALVYSGCAKTKTVENTRHLVETPEKRAGYLSKMLKALCSDLGPHNSGTLAYDKAAEIVRNEMAAALPFSELDRYSFEKWELIGNSEFYVGDLLLETYPAPGCKFTPADGVSGILKKNDEGTTPYIIVNEASGETLAYVTVSSFGRAVPRLVGREDERPLPRFNIGRQDVHHLESAIKKFKTKALIVYLHSDVESKFPSIRATEFLEKLKNKDII